MTAQEEDPKAVEEGDAIQAAALPPPVSGDQENMSPAILQERVLKEASHLLMDLTMVVTIERNVAGKADLVRHTLTLEALASLRKSGKGPC